jgi:hypothetical protein
MGAPLQPGPARRNRGQVERVLDLARGQALRGVLEVQRPASVVLDTSRRQ